MRPIKGAKPLSEALDELGVRWDTVGGKKVGRVSLPAERAETSAEVETLPPSRYVSRPENRFALGWARSLFLACLFALALRYCAWCYSIAVELVHRAKLS